jgi:hypothetical protein
MNTLNILVQSKEDPKNILNTDEKVKAFPDGMTVVFMEGATKGGQMGIEFIIKGKDDNDNSVLISHGLTENNMEALCGALIGTRARFGRMPKDEYESVRYYVKQQVNRFITKHGIEGEVEQQLRKFFNC